MLEGVPVAVLLRFAALFDSGYVHPDEFFQSPEVAAHDVLGLSLVELPWEFSCAREGQLYRSVVGPALTSGLPLAILRWLGLEQSGHAVILAPRLVVFLLSLPLDNLFYAVFGERAYYVWRTSWVAIVLLVRPTSNALEAWALLLAVWLAQRRRLFGLGLLCAFGLWNRITFPVFVAPVVALALANEDDYWRAARGKGGKGTQRAAVGGSRTGILAIGMVRLAIGFALAATLHVLCDSLYAARNPQCTGFFLKLDGFRLVLTPLNSLLYNSDRRNLASHGEHPHWTHVVVNMQLLFSPIWLLTTLGGRSPVLMDARLRLTMRAVCFCALCALSIAPHQEARFLLPLLVPVAALTADVTTQSSIMRNFWKAFNIMLGCFFGFVHQAAVVRALLDLDRGLMRETGLRCVATYETLMAPRMLLANLSNGPLGVVDLGGSASRAPDVHAEVSRRLRHAGGACAAQSEWALLLPSTAINDFPEGVLGEGTLLDRYFPHWSGERPAWTLHDLSLEAHRLKLRP
jgi:phosphatidylinositol glycan class Z